MSETRVVRPADHEETALVLADASREGRSVHVRGNGSWEQDRPADLVLSTRNLTGPLEIDASDLVATVPAGMILETLNAELRRHGVWFAADPPGAGRTVGSVVASGSSGPLAAGFGPLKDQLLGLTFVTGHGAVVTAGGKVVKNVAGFDLTRLACGSFGTLGVITTINIRLHTVQQADTTLIASGDFTYVLRLAQKLRDSNRQCQAAEIMSSGDADSEWKLAVRILGPERSHDTNREGIEQGGLKHAATLEGERSAAFWKTVQTEMARGDTVLRTGIPWTVLPHTLEKIQSLLDPARATMSALAGIFRWTGSARCSEIKELRDALSSNSVPVTLERATPKLLAETGRYGNLHPGVTGILNSIGRSFDPSNTLSRTVPIV